MLTLKVLVAVVACVPGAAMPASPKHTIENNFFISCFLVQEHQTIAPGHEADGRRGAPGKDISVALVWARNPRIHEKLANDKNWYVHDAPVRNLARPHFTMHSSR